MGVIINLQETNKALKLKDINDTDTVGEMYGMVLTDSKTKDADTRYAKTFARYEVTNSKKFCFGQIRYKLATYPQYASMFQEEPQKV